MKRLNFIPKNLRQKAEAPGTLILAAAAAVFFVDVSTVLTSYWINVSRQQAELARLQSQNAELSKKISAVGGSLAAANVSETLDNLKRVRARKSSWATVLKELSGIMPEGVWLTTLSNGKSRATKPTVQSAADAGELLFQGEASSEKLIAKFLTTLEKSRYFSGVQLKYTELEANVRPARYRFELTVPVKTILKGVEDARL